MKIDIKSGHRKVPHKDRFGNVGDRLQPVVEVWIDGICLVHECNNPEESRNMVLRLARAMGIS